MRLVLDLQASQTPSSGKRGIGRYSLMLALAMVRMAGDDEVRVALNADFPEGADEVMASFDGLLSPTRFSHLTTAPRTVGSHGVASQRARAAIQRHHLAALAPDAVHCSSMMEGLDPLALSAFDLDRLRPTVVGSTLYDLIPLIYPERYLDMKGVPKGFIELTYSEYARHDVLAAISASCRNDAIERLGIPTERVWNIGADVDPRFRVLPDAARRGPDVLGRHGITDSFILYTGGIDYRKNVEGLIEAFGRLPRALRDAYQLVIVCRVTDEQRLELAHEMRRHGVADRVVLTGFVPDDDLVVLNNLCALFVFPSLYEGFGLPVLEAMRCGAPVIASNASSLPEIVGREDAMFDPTDPSDIAGRMAQALQNEDFRTSLVETGRVRAAAFSWDRSAEILWEAYRESHRRRRRELADEPARVAMVSPVPPSQSGIASYAIDVVSSLDAHADITLLTHTDRPADPRAARADDDALAAWDTVDRVYQFGNSFHHERMWDEVTGSGGTVVLHDFYLSGIVHWLDVEGARGGLFDREWKYSHAGKGEPSDRRTTMDAWPMNRRILDAADGVFLHSRYSMDLIETFYPGYASTRAIYMPQLRTLPALPDEREATRQRARLDLPAKGPVVISIGFVDPVKYVDEVAAAFLRLAEVYPDGRFVFVGKGIKGFSEETRAAIKASDGVSVTEFVDDETYDAWLTVADLAIQLRRETRGETSRAVLDAMANGVPVIVNQFATFTDLDDNAVCKLSRAPDVAEIEAALARLLGDPVERQRLGERGRAVIKRDHSPERVAEAFRYGLARFRADAEQRDLRRRMDEIAVLMRDVEEVCDVSRLVEALLFNAQPGLTQPRAERAVSDLAATGTAPGTTDGG